MRVTRALTYLSLAATLAACSGQHLRTEPDPMHDSGTLTWDSGPLDRDFQKERVALDDRHRREGESPKADESRDQMIARHAMETKDLQARYDRGKALHSQSLPATAL
ncbi:MAG: hypothetical protein HY275_13095 [Gemmatimonadetes bacterium]|nr:hypothetical protein [Gemmatimonadota bacterium]